MGGINDLYDDIDWHIVSCPDDRTLSDDFSWAEEALRDISRRITPADAQRQLGLTLIKQRRSVLRGRANRILADIGVHKAWPPEWPIFAGGLPLVVRDEHVMLRAITPDDLTQWEIEQRRKAAIQFAASNLACDGAQWAGEEMRRLELHRLPDLPKPVRP